MAAHEPIPPPNQTARGDVSLTRISLPFAMVLTFGSFLVVAGYKAGGIMQGMARDKSEVETRLSAIEREIAGVKSILSERSQAAPSPLQSCRCK